MDRRRNAVNCSMTFIQRDLWKRKKNKALYLDSVITLSSFCNLILGLCDATYESFLIGYYIKLSYAILLSLQPLSSFIIYTWSAWQTTNQRKLILKMRYFSPCGDSAIAVCLLHSMQLVLLSLECLD